MHACDRAVNKSNDYRLINYITQNGQTVNRFAFFFLVILFLLIFFFNNNETANKQKSIINK